MCIRIQSNHNSVKPYYSQCFSKANGYQRYGHETAFLDEKIDDPRCALCGYTQREHDPLQAPVPPRDKPRCGTFKQAYYIIYTGEIKKGISNALTTFNDNK